MPSDVSNRNTRAEYAPKKLIYRTFRRLREYVLPHQLFVDGSELGLRFLEEHAEKSTLGPAMFLDDLRKRLRIPSSGFDFSEIFHRGAQAYIALAYQVAEQFITDFGAEYRDLKRLATWSTRDGKNDLNAFDALLANMQAGADVVRRMPEYEILRYYGAVRHAVVHGTNQAIAKANRLHASMMADHSEYLAAKYNKLVAPNRIVALRFDDHQLLMLVLGRFAARLNDACDLTMADILAKARSDGEFMRKLVRNRVDDGSLDGVVRELRQLHGFREVDGAWLKAEFSKLLETIPTHRERQRATYRRR